MKGGNGFGAFDCQRLGMCPDPARAVPLAGLIHAKVTGRKQRSPFFNFLRADPFQTETAGVFLLSLPLPMEVLPALWPDGPFPIGIFFFIRQHPCADLGNLLIYFLLYFLSEGKGLDADY